MFELSPELNAAEHLRVLRLLVRNGLALKRGRDMPLFEINRTQGSNMIFEFDKSHCLSP